MLTIALTGGIGSGKSTVSDRFSTLGVPVVDADVAARALTTPGAPALAEIRQAFGPRVFAADGGLDRAALRRLVFADAQARKRLEAILHPLIRARMQAEAAAADGPYVILVVPLLFETGQHHIADRVLVVDAPEAAQVQRVHERSGLEAAEIKHIIASQIGRTERLERADDVIDNSGDRASLVAQTDALHKRYLQLADEAQPTGGARSA